ncbi:hypothetical protein [Nocardiopsis aegyptia]|uniref:Uncharacterized protein n=1 Tax=Nocardiopsis aegyptia TaxID=220378 RepID=A0A7Z0EJD0_9ACTN|nr:hypothetical protein [Nocardiopsis aegyptia]NYJ33042.1 hypothetical protein [Nocardiopsis aegyptia]
MPSPPSSDDPSSNAGFLRQIGALIAPLAKNSDAPIGDLRHLAVAEKVFDAYATALAEDGLSKGDLREACDEVCDEQAFEQRFGTFTSLEMLKPTTDKPHHGRYFLDPNSMAVLIAVERLRDHGGISELLGLLDRTRADLEHGRASEHEIRDALRQSQRFLNVFTDYLRHMIRSRPLRELIEERRRSSREDALERAQVVHGLVAERFRHLDRMALDLVMAAERYVEACSELIHHLHANGVHARDLGILRYDQYRDASLTASIEDLSAVFDDILVDPPEPGVTAMAVADAVESLAPRRPETGPPPRPEAPPPADDPLAGIERRRKADRRVSRDQAELALHEQGNGDLTALMRRLGWPGLILLLADLFKACGPDQPFLLETADVLLVEPGSEVTYLSPVRLIRNPKEAGDVFGPGTDGSHTAPPDTSEEA